MEMVNRVKKLLNYWYLFRLKLKKQVSIYCKLRFFLIIPSLRVGGAERVMSVLANRLAELNHEVHIVLLLNDAAFYSIDSRVQIHKLNFENKGRVAKVISELRTFFQLRKLIKSEQPQVVLSFMTKYNLLTLFATRFLNTKVFVSDRSNPKKVLPTAVRLLRKLLYRRATGIIAQTQLAKKLLAAETQQKNIEVIHNPLNEMNFSHSAPREKVVLNVGRLVATKGQLRLIEEFAKIPASEWRLLILGDGPMKGDLQAKIKELNLEERVILQGAVSNVNEYLQKAGIFVFSSFSEGFPNSLAEAMYAGLPCISFDCDAGPKEIIQTMHNGILVEVGDFEHLRSEMERLIMSEQLRKDLAAEAVKIYAKLNVNSICDQYISFFNSAK
jgi:GalNAc-alpha-(1->4)-GalNAc-alpha-(1->3)-diNAcBac-PP-undecaprenol alpha-1,4-N-acetyl-D-galactosaminyltransferase